MSIPTVYRGVEYRSRLEARWASLFTRLGWHFTYEPFDGDGYIPDFLIHGKAPLLVEIKPAATLEDYQKPIDKLERGVRGHWGHDLLILGADPLPRLPNPTWGHDPTAGLLGEVNPEGEWNWANAMWFTCRNCGSDSIFHEYMTYNGRPCGCYEGDHFLGQISTAYLKTHWDDATNDVKWRGRAA